MSQSHIPEHLWNLAVAHAVHLINRLPSPYLDNDIPYQILYHKAPDFSTLWIFGCLAYACAKSANRNKLDPRSQKCVHLGYCNETKGYLLYGMHSSKLFLSRDSLFFEHIFPYMHSVSESSTIPSPQFP